MSSTQVKLNEIPGKTVDAVFPWLVNTEVCITFTDNTFLLIGIEGSISEMPILHSPSLELDRHGDAAVASGLYTAQERDDAIVAREQAKADAIAAREYEYYLVLKARYDL